jgi:hypothetical protein
VTTLPLDDGVVVEGVAEDQIALAADGGDDGGVGGETHANHAHSLLAHKSRRGYLNLLRVGFCAVDNTFQTAFRVCKYKWVGVIVGHMPV